jgi:hypothetical protein
VVRVSVWPTVGAACTMLTVRAGTVTVEFVPAVRFRTV